MQTASRSPAVNSILSLLLQCAAPADVVCCLLAEHPPSSWSRSFPNGSSHQWRSYSISSFEPCQLSAASNRSVLLDQQSVQSQSQQVYPMTMDGCMQY